MYVRYTQVKKKNKNIKCRDSKTAKKGGCRGIYYSELFYYHPYLVFLLFSLNVIISTWFSYFLLFCYPYTSCYLYTLSILNSIFFSAQVLLESRQPSHLS